MNHTGTIRLETKRLILRRYERADAEAMFQNWVADPKVARFWNWEPHKDICETRTLLEAWISEYGNCRYYHWVIESKKSQQAIGYIYLADIHDASCSASVHYLISSKLWNQGFASEALSRILHFAMNDVGCKTIFSWHHIDNPASGRVMEKCGMRFEKREYRIMECDRISGEYIHYRIG